jgi:hypothetical protein
MMENTTPLANAAKEVIESEERLREQIGLW